MFSKKEYYDDKESQFSNYDLTLGWDKMAKSDVLKNIEITQSDQRFYWHTEDSSLISLYEIRTINSNNHIVIGNDMVANILKQIKKDDFVSIQGYLISIVEKDISWRSSTIRDDDSNGVCELIWVTNITIAN